MIKKYRLIIGLTDNTGLLFYADTLEETHKLEEEHVNKNIDKVEYVIVHENGIEIYSGGKF